MKMLTFVVRSQIWVIIFIYYSFLTNWERNALTSEISYILLLATSVCQGWEYQIKTVNFFRTMWRLCFIVLLPYALMNHSGRSVQSSHHCYMLIQPLHLFIHPSMSKHPSTHLSFIYSQIHVYSPIHSLSAHPSIQQFTHQSIHPSIHPSIQQFTHHPLSIYPSNSLIYSSIQLEFQFWITHLGPVCLNRLYAEYTDFQTADRQS